jgi:hypothetical protein
MATDAAATRLEVPAMADPSESLLDWPPEAARAGGDEPRWAQPGSNICLDFHGDPVRARLVVFSDGNHHMALEESLRAFLAAHPDADDIFYATTPPGVVIDLLKSGRLHLGNLCLSVVPHAMIGPTPIIEQLARDGRLSAPRPFMRSRGQVLLVHAGNPRGIGGVNDLLRPGVRLFLSNPRRERASFEVYRDTLVAVARREGADGDAVARLLDGSSGNAVFGERIHHREAPAALAGGAADAAVLYYHLALRYTRILPGRFEIVPLGSPPDEAAPPAGHAITDYACARAGDGGAHGDALLEFLAGEAVTAIYERHGLTRPA